MTWIIVGVAVVVCGLIVLMFGIGRYRATTPQEQRPESGAGPYRKSRTPSSTEEDRIPHEIGCAWCGRPIRPNEPISLMWGKSRDAQPIEPDPENAKLCCMRTDCAPDGSSFAGHWDGLKPVWKFGGKTVLQHTFTSGGMVFGNIGRLDED